MDGDALRLLQAPLKERYRSDPSSARTPVGAHGDYTNDDALCLILPVARLTRRN
jgi:hypothetical protein